MNDLNRIKEDLRSQIINELKLEGLRPTDITDEMPLFGDGLGLDSIDALELVVIMEEFHGVRITDESVGKEVLYSINTMAAYIQKVQSETV